MNCHVSSVFGLLKDVLKILFLKILFLRGRGKKCEQHSPVMFANEEEGFFDGKKVVKVNGKVTSNWEPQ